MFRKVDVAAPAKNGVAFQKKSTHAAEQARADVVVKLKDWHATQETVDAERLIFRDETGSKTDLTRLRGMTEGGNRLVEAVGAEVVYLPPYSLDLIPIENLFSKLKELIRELKPRSPDRIVDAIAQVLAKINLNDRLVTYLHYGCDIT